MVRIVAGNYLHNGFCHYEKITFKSDKLEFEEAKEALPAYQIDNDFARIEAVPELEQDFEALKKHANIVSEAYTEHIHEIAKLIPKFCQKIDLAMSIIEGILEKHNV